MQDTLEGKLHAAKCESGNVEVQWNSIKECVSDCMSDLVGKVDRTARKPWVTQEIIVKWMNEGNGRGSTVKKEGRTAEC